MAKENTKKQLIDESYYLNPVSPQTPNMTASLSEMDALELKSDTAQYIERIAADLCVLAVRADLNFAAYLLDMVRIEADDQIKALKRQRESQEDH